MFETMQPWLEQLSAALSYKYKPEGNYTNAINLQRLNDSLMV
jgi:hypothetical protein